jgi:hypothetical protein
MRVIEKRNAVERLRQKLLDQVPVNMNNNGVDVEE